MFYQLKWMSPQLPDSAIAGQAGILSASFPAAQFLTAMMWGRIADSPRFGRKAVLLIGLCGTSRLCPPRSDVAALTPAPRSNLVSRVRLRHAVLARAPLPVHRRRAERKCRGAADHVSRRRPLHRGRDADLFAVQGQRDRAGEEIPVEGVPPDAHDL